VVISVHDGGILTWRVISGHQWSSVVISGHQWSSEVIRGNQAHLQVSSRRARLESDPQETVGIFAEGDGHSDSGEHETHLLMREAIRGHWRQSASHETHLLMREAIRGH